MAEVGCTGVAAYTRGLLVGGMPQSAYISRVVLENYKSIRRCDVSLDSITFLVGPNGAGKSNFVEALRFLSYAVGTSLEQALASRSGFRTVLYRGAEPGASVTFELHFRLDEFRNGRYFLALQSDPTGSVTVAREECGLFTAGRKDWFKVANGVVTSSEQLTPAASAEKLYLVNASGLPVFEPVYRALSSIVVYNPMPEEIQGFHLERGFRYLDRKGTGLAEAVHSLEKSHPEQMIRVSEYLRRINPSVVKIDAGLVDSNYTLRFELSERTGVVQSFPSQNMSDGTLRALAILIALFQINDRYPLTLIGLEEPAAGVHPAAAGVLFDALIEGSRSRQVVVTSHSPDLLDREDLPEHALKAVVMDQGETIIGEVEAAGKSAIREHLFTAGELLRMDQLRPEGASERAGS